MKRLKVCGLTRACDVHLASQLGADFLGFVLAESPRSVSLEQLKELVTANAGLAQTVAVKVNPGVEQVERALGLVDRVQLHGSESPEFCSLFGRRVIKAFRVSGPDDLKKTLDYQDAVGAFLLDSFVAGVAGGTGKAFDWSYLQEFSFTRPTFLAGGIRQSNLAQALAVDSVAALDLSSGIENSPGCKDPQKMRAFVQEKWSIETVAHRSRPS